MSTILKLLGDEGSTVLRLLANLFKDEILPLILPIIKNNLISSDWKIKESGIFIFRSINYGSTLNNNNLINLNILII